MGLRTSFTVLAAAAGLIIGTASPVGSINVLEGSPSPDPVDLSFCVQSAPSSLPGLIAADDRAIADGELVKAIDEWNDAPGTIDEFALDLSKVSHSPTCSADITITSADIPAPGQFAPSTNVITLDSSRSWATNGSSTKFDYLAVLMHEMGHALGLGHQGPGKDGGVWFWNRNSGDPTMVDAIGVGSTANRDLEDDGRGGASWISQVGDSGTVDYWSPNVGFEDFAKNWAKGPAVVVGVGSGTQGPKTGLRRAKLPTGVDSWVKTWVAYDPWDTDNGKYNSGYPSMTEDPLIKVSGYVRNRTTTGVGEVEILSRTHVFEYESETSSGVPMPKDSAVVRKVGSWSMWNVDDSMLSTELGCCDWKPLTGTVSMSNVDISAFMDGDAEWHRAVKVGIKVMNGTSKDILLDEAGLSGGMDE